MSAIRQIVVSAIVFAMVPSAVLRAASHTVEYVGGTVKSIPVYSAGSLNLDDAKELSFSYGQSVYKIPYDQITGTQITQSGGGGHHLFGKIPVPSLPGKKKETLSISYKDPAGPSGTLNFELSAHQASEAREAIAEKKAPKATTASQPEEWWGDRYWKTNRNKATWEGAPQTAQTAPTPSGTK
jgi:hypothetical protein